MTLETMKSTGKKEQSEKKKIMLVPSYCTDKYIGELRFQSDGQTSVRERESRQTPITLRLRCG